MDKGRLSGVGGGVMLPCLGQFFGFSSVGSGFGGMKGESPHSTTSATMSKSGQFGQLFLFGSRQVKLDLNRMLDFQRETLPIEESIRRTLLCILP